jgi:hypothetical protein
MEVKTTSKLILSLDSSERTAWRLDEFSKWLKDDGMYTFFKAENFR